MKLVAGSWSGDKKNKIKKQTSKKKSTKPLQNYCIFHAFILFTRYETIYST